MGWLKLPTDQISLKLCWVLIAFAYAFSVTFRILLANYTSIAGLKESGEFINTPDGYFFAKGALDLLQFGKEQTISSPTGSLLPQLTVFLAKIVPINFETLVFFMPVFMSSLLVVPLVLIGCSIGQATIGLVAALLGSVAHGYYARSLAGYYDTDMLVVVFPMFVICFVITAILSKKKFYLALITIAVSLYQWWYPQAYSLNMAVFFSTVFYGLVFDRKNIFNYQIAFFVLLGFLGIVPTIKMLFAIFLCFLFYYRPLLVNKFFWYLFAAAFACFAATAGIDPLLSQLRQYFVRGDEVPTSSFQFYNVISTVREAEIISLWHLMNRISGHPVTFILSCLGYLLAVFAYRPLLLLLPMVGLGFFALFGGLRFTMYAVPALALGLGYVFVIISKSWRPPLLRYSAIAAMTVLALYHNYAIVKPLKPREAFGKNEILVLRHLARLTKPTDYVFSWWDYGHALRYYTNAHAFIDGNKHGGDYNLPVAFVLTEANLTAAAHLLRIVTEHDAANFTNTKKAPGYIESYMIKNKVKDPNQFFTAIADKNYPLPHKSRDVYLVTSYHMLALLGSMQLFSNIDLSTGKQKHLPFYFATNNLKNEDDAFVLDGKYRVDRKKWTVNWGNNTQKLASMIIAEYKNQRLEVKKIFMHADGFLNLVLLRNYNSAILADNQITNGAFFKLFVLEENDPRYFEPVAITPRMKIYKLKI